MSGGAEREAEASVPSSKRHGHTITYGPVSAAQSRTATEYARQEMTEPEGKKLHCSNPSADGSDLTTSRSRLIGIADQSAKS